MGEKRAINIWSGCDQPAAMAAAVDSNGVPSSGRLIQTALAPAAENPWPRRDNRLLQADTPFPASESDFDTGTVENSGQVSALGISARMASFSNHAILQTH